MHHFLIFKTKFRKMVRHFSCVFYTLIKHTFATKQSARYIWTSLKINIFHWLLLLLRLWGSAPDRRSRDVRIWPYLAFGFLDKRSGYGVTLLEFISKTNKQMQ